MRMRKRTEEERGKEQEINEEEERKMDEEERNETEEESRGRGGKNHATAAESAEQKTSGAVAADTGRTEVQNGNAGT
jgi:hypothetical protein